MQNTSWIRTAIAGLIGLGLIILVVILLVRAFSGGSTTKPGTAIDLGSYQNTAATVTLLVDGAPTQIDQDHRQIRITVSQTQNEIEVLQGYQGNVIDTRSYPNNSDAFGVFLQSLKLMNFTKGKTDAALADYRGYCPFGSRYVFTFNDGTTDKFHYWATSCGSIGTYQGALKNTLSLIRNQVPQQDFQTMTATVPISF